MEDSIQTRRKQLLEEHFLATQQKKHVSKVIDRIETALTELANLEREAKKPDESPTG